MDNFGLATAHVSHLQKKAVVARILKMFPISESFVPKERLYVEAIMYEARHASMQCPICMEPVVTKTEDGRIDTSEMWFAPERKTEHWSNKPCGHACCRSCISQWAV